MFRFNDGSNRGYIYAAVLFQMLVAGVSGQHANITTPEMSVSEDEGEDAVLDCDATGDPTPDISWYKVLYDGTTLPLRDIGTPLTLTEVTYADAATYVCRADNTNPDDDIFDEARFVLDVLGLPEIFVPNPRVGQAPGKIARLECEAISNPLENFHWKHKGRKLVNSDNKYTTGRIRRDRYTYMYSLEFEVKPEDYGEYFCGTENPMGLAGGTVVLSEPSMYVPKVSVFPESVIVHQNQPAQFNCTVNDIFTDKDFLTWWWISPTNGSIKIFSAQMTQYPTNAIFTHPHKFMVEGRYSLIVRNVQFEDHGTFICNINNQRNYSASLTVVDGAVCQQASPSVAPGQDANMWCSLQVNGTAALWNVEWQHKSKRLSSVNYDRAGIVYRVLTFPVKTADQGYYQCRMTSVQPVFTDFCVLSLIVSGNSDPSAAALEDVELAEVDSKSTTTITLVCVVAGVILAAITSVAMVARHYRKS